MKPLKIYTLILLLLSLSAEAQQHSGKDYSEYISDASENALIFRGRRALQYELPHNGHQYWDQERFIPGNLTYNGKEYYDVLLNIDANTNEVLVKKDDISQAIRLEREYIDALSIGESGFTDLERQGVKGAEEGFYEVILGGSQPVYRRIAKIFTESALPISEDSLGYPVSNFNLSYYDYFERRVRFYTVKDGRLRKLSRSKASKLAGHEIN